jgi:plastocyanin
VLLILASTVVALFAVNACGSATPSTTGHDVASDTTAASRVSGSAMIHIHDFRYLTPASVPPGAQVEVMNMDGEAHTVTADAGGSFDVQAPAGQTVTFIAPSKPGRYSFHCDYHAQMHGVLIVQ